MDKYGLIATTPEHVEELIETMCQEDVDECWAAAHCTPSEAFKFALRGSRDTITGLANGRVACICGIGIISRLTGTGSPWMLT